MNLNTGAQGPGGGETYPTIGAGLGVKASSKRWTVYGGVDFGAKNNTTSNSTLVDRDLLAIETGVKSYLKEAYRGLNVSLYGNYHQESTDPTSGVTMPNSARRSDAMGFGCSAKLTNGMVAAFNTGSSGDFDSESFLHFTFQIGYLF